jgi:hypothetical protein
MNSEVRKVDRAVVHHSGTTETADRAATLRWVVVVEVGPDAVSDCGVRPTKASGLALSVRATWRDPSMPKRLASIFRDVWLVMGV